MFDCFRGEFGRFKHPLTETGDEETDDQEDRFEEVGLVAELVAALSGGVLSGTTQSGIDIIDRRRGLSIGEE